MGFGLSRQTMANRVIAGACLLDRVYVRLAAGQGRGYRLTVSVTVWFQIWIEYRIDFERLHLLVAERQIINPLRLLGPRHRRPD